MNYKVFIGYSHEDNNEAQYIHDCLTRIVEFIPYKAELYPAYGENFKKRIQNELYESHFMIVLLTENGKNSQWVNQEIGYAYALQKRPQKKYADLPVIIPISHEQVQVKGFITKDTTDFLILGNFQSFEYVVANIIFTIRRHISGGLEEGLLHHRITCSKCVNKKGFPYEWSPTLPAHEDIAKAIRLNECIFTYDCPKCKTKNSIDARTFLSYKMAER